MCIKCRPTCVLVGQTSHQSTKVTICVGRRINMTLEEAACFIQVELVLLRMNARVACQSLNACQDAGTARMKGRQEPVSWQSQCLTVFRVMHLQAQACVDMCYLQFTMSVAQQPDQDKQFQDMLTSSEPLPNAAGEQSFLSLSKLSAVAAPERA